jgi:hypothetical protein
MTVVGTTDAVESTGVGRRMVAELRRGSALGRHFARRSATAASRGPTPAPDQASEAAADIVVASSGNLAHVYFTGLPGRPTSGDIEACAPGVIDGLRRHPGIGAVIARTAEGPVVLGSEGSLGLASGRLEGTDPLLPFGLGAADAIRRLEAFSTSGDLILLGDVDPVTGEVTGLEELIGSHGGLGGWQTEPFILVPAPLELTEGPLVGAASLYRQLVAWQHIGPGPTMVIEGERRNEGSS